MTETSTQASISKSEESLTEREYLDDLAEREAVELHVTNKVNEAIQELGLEGFIDEDVASRIIFEGVFEMIDAKEGGREDQQVDISSYAFGALIPSDRFSAPTEHFSGAINTTGLGDTVVVQDLHFLPSIRDRQGNLTSNFDDGETDTVAQKLESIGVGFSEAIAYVIAVESGLAPRPDVIHGTTNPVFAEFVSQLGFVQVGLENDAEMLRLMREEFGEFEPLEPLGNQEVACRYDAFRDNLVNLYKSKGHKIVARYQKMLEEREARFGQDA